MNEDMRLSAASCPLAYSLLRLGSSNANNA